MTENEARKIIAVMMVSYPNFKPVDTDIMAATWAEILSEYTYEQVSIALKCFITSDTKGFAPSIGQLIDKIIFLEQTEQLNELEAWALVSNALRNGYYGAEKEFANLPPLVQKAVGTPDNLRHWSQTDMSSVENVIQSNFIKTYRTVVSREKEERKYPKEMRMAIEQAKQKMIESK